jgi:hypothetical protein
MFETLPEQVVERYCIGCERKTLHRCNLKVIQRHEVTQFTCKGCGRQEIR